MKVTSFLREKNVAGHDLRVFACTKGRVGIEDLEDGEFLFWLGSKLSAKMIDLARANKAQEVLDFVVANCEVKYFESDSEDGFSGYYAYESGNNGGIARWNGK